MLTLWVAAILAIHTVTLLRESGWELLKTHGLFTLMINQGTFPTRFCSEWGLNRIGTQARLTSRESQSLLRDLPSLTTLPQSQNRLHCPSYGLHFILSKHRSIWTTETTHALYLGLCLISLRFVQERERVVPLLRTSNHRACIVLYSTVYSLL